MSARFSARSLVLAALMAALMAVLSPWAIPVGPVPVTLGVFAVFLAGALLPPAGAAAAVAVYLLLGLCGLPVFSGFGAGPQKLFGPTGGYLFGYFLLAAGLAFACRFLRAFWLRAAAAAGFLAVFYLVGTLWFTRVTGATFLQGLLVCVAPFVLADTLKLLAALALARALAKRRVGPEKGGV